MAKVKNALVELPPEPPVEDPVEEASLPPPAPKWLVRLVCPTPLLHTELVVSAETEDEARKKFMAANGICDSVHNWTVEKVA